MIKGAVSPSGRTLQVVSSVFFFSVPSSFFGSTWGKVLLFPPLLLCSELSLPAFRVAPLSFACPLHGVLLELITADTRRGTDTAKGSDILTTLRWCLGDDSRGKKLPGKDGRELLLWDEPEYNIRLFFGEVGLLPLSSSLLYTFSCSGSVFCGGAVAPGDPVWLVPELQPPVAPPALSPLSPQFWSCSLRPYSESDPSVLDFTSGT